MENDKLTFTYGNLELRVQNFHYGLTYSGLVSGEPDTFINEMLINDFSHPKDWGVRKSMLKNGSLYESENV